jgi:hypothetical protein
MLLRAAAVVAMLLAASPAVARMHAGPSQLHAGHRLQGAIAPLDGGGSLAAPAAAYSLRKLKSAYAGAAISLRRASDNAEQDINFLGFTGFTGAPLDIAAANAFCNATTCFVKGIYDQSGNGRDAFQFSAGAQPAFVSSCQNGRPCARFPNAEQLQSSSVTWASVITTLSTVAKRTSGTGQCNFIRKINNVLLSDVAGTWYATGFIAGGYPVTAAENTWHAGMAVINGASSVVRIDVAETTGSITGGGGGGVAYFTGAASTSCDWAEGIIWDGYALTAAERAVLQSNQKSFWGTP